MNDTHSLEHINKQPPLLMKIYLTYLSIYLSLKEASAIYLSSSVCYFFFPILLVSAFSAILQCLYVYARVTVCCATDNIQCLSWCRNLLFLALLHLLLSNHCDIFIPGTLYFVCGLMEQNSEVSNKHEIAVRKMVNGRKQPTQDGSQESHSIKKCSSVGFADTISTKWC